MCWEIVDRTPWKEVGRVGVGYGAVCYKRKGLVISVAAGAPRATWGAERVKTQRVGTRGWPSVCPVVCPLLCACLCGCCGMCAEDDSELNGRRNGKEEEGGQRSDWAPNAT